jgi:transcriptional regulator with XRE-family HTH domain
MEKKKEVLDLIDEGISQRTIAVQCGVAKSTAGNIKTGATLKAWEENYSNERKRKMRRTYNEDVDAVTLQFFLKCRGMNIPVTGPAFQAKAREIAHRLHVENFQASNGCLELFRTRHSINFRFVSGESAAVDMAAVEDWKSKLHQVINEYPPSNKFNADETGLFHQQMPRKSLIQRGKNVKMGNYPRKD